MSTFVRLEAPSAALDAVLVTTPSSSIASSSSFFTELLSIDDDEGSAARRSRVIACSIGDAKVTIEKRGLRLELEGLRPKEAGCDSISVFRGDVRLRWMGFVSL